MPLTKCPRCGYAFQGDSCPQCGHKVSAHTPDMEDLALQWLEGHADDATLPLEWLKGNAAQPQRPHRKHRQPTPPKRTKDRSAAPKPQSSPAKSAVARPPQPATKAERPVATSPEPPGQHADRTGEATATSIPQPAAAAESRISLTPEDPTPARPLPQPAQQPSSRRRSLWFLIGLILGAALGFIGGQHLERMKLETELMELERRVQIHQAWLEEELDRRHRAEAELARLRHRTLAEPASTHLPESREPD